MKKINNKGFTLVELIATIVILSLVITIGATSITAIINNSKEKDYELLIKEIKNATEEYYIECNFSANSSIDCPVLSPDGYYQQIYIDNKEYKNLTLGDLVLYGFLKGNSVDSNQKFTLVNPKNNKDISYCPIKYKYENGNTIVVKVSGDDYCPDSY